MTAVVSTVSTAALSTSSGIAQARSFLFVPADRPERHSRAIDSGADAVIIDLEDAVGANGKNDARSSVEQTFAVLASSARSRVLVRINAEGTPWFDEDVALVTKLAADGLGGVMVPKVEGAALMRRLAATCPRVALLPQTESGAGLDALNDVAAAGGVVRLCLGHLDLQNDLGITCGPEETEIAHARWDIVRASRRHGLPPPVDSVTVDTRDPEVTARDTSRALRQGFGGKLCIHPAQILAVHQAFRPSSEEEEWARRVVAAMGMSSGGACTVDGRMVDAPVISKALNMLARII